MQKYSYAIESAAVKSSTAFHEDAFYEYFQPYRHAGSENDIWGGHGLETYGNDLNIVRHLDPDFLWTIVEGDVTNSEWIIPGFHFVNRLCYLVTAKPHNDAPIEFRISRQHSFLTPLGLKRQMLKLERLLAMHANNDHAKSGY